MRYTIEETIALLDKEFPDYSIEWNDMEEFARKHGFEFYNGVSRYCLYQKHWKEVIKISRFEEDPDHDYNEIELEHYRKACELGCADILLPTRKVATLKSSLGVFVQTRYTCSYSELNCGEADMLRRATRMIKLSPTFQKSMRALYDCPSTIWYARAWQVYGKKFMKQFEKFTRECEVGDLHTSNIGFLNNRPIILDYAGYYG